MDKGTPLGGLESEDNAEPSHGLHTVLSSLWGRGCLAHRLRIWFPEDEGVRRPKKPNRPRRLTGPARRGSGHDLITLGAVPAVPATLPHPRGSVPRPPSGRPGASAAIRRPRAAQAHASLGRAVRHRQGSEAQDIQAGQQPRRGLQQRLEHPTATSLLPLRCFQVVRTPRSRSKSNHQGRVSLASAKPDPPSGARRGEPPLHQNFPRKKTSIKKKLSRPPAMSVTGPQETNKGAYRWQGRPSRGTPTPLGYGYLTRRLPRKMTLTWASYHATDERVRIRKTKGKETQSYITIIKCSGIGGRKRHICIQRKLLRQNQASPGEGAAPSASSPPSARSALASDDGTSRRISASKVVASTALGPRRPRQAYGLRPGRLHLRRGGNTPR
jgi:hypothetical protein